MGGAFCKKVENGGCFFAKKEENGGCFFLKIWKVGVFFGKKVENRGLFFVKMWTYPERRCIVYSISIFYFIFTFYLFGGCVRIQRTPLPTGLG